MERPLISHAANERGLDKLCWSATTLTTSLNNVVLVTRTSYDETVLQVYHLPKMDA